MGKSERKNRNEQRREGGSWREKIIEQRGSKRREKEGKLIKNK